MKLEILERNENKLLRRTEVRFRVEHAGGPTPSRKEVIAGLSAALGVPEELIALERISGLHGSTSSHGLARVYPSKEDLVKIEREYLLRRGMPKEEKTEETEKEEKPKAETKKEAEEGKGG
jgi:small subunit ribosomal protein S24e